MHLYVTTEGICRAEGAELALDLPRETGEPRQDARTTEFVHDIPTVIATQSQYSSLEPATSSSPGQRREAACPTVVGSSPLETSSRCVGKGSVSLNNGVEGPRVNPS